jgi:hypothetical protein
MEVLEMAVTQISYCGIDCMQCPALRATVNNDDVLREKAAKMFSTGKILLKKEDINCYGCHSDYRCTKLCMPCKIRACADMKDLGTCAECDNYPCDKINEFSPVGTDRRSRLDSIIPWRR